ncbi:Kazal-type serine protease inhibitor domain-containing protein [Tellurirhabdus rosea]|uniref:Kazal-type serine protease inhibitor domain-containing protein n=1 Tax=Tellurirhabdus rosea TaxID=2674997 RepID=UPI0022550B50|nr:Kazal-type serine protease inhibitor domain-containing protein [Tellurirhabdus rosea]
MKPVLCLSLLLLASACENSFHAPADPVSPPCVEQPYKGGGCYALYKPVCGCNGKTYPNACEAENYGIKSYTEGECAKK